MTVLRNILLVISGLFVLLMIFGQNKSPNTAQSTAQVATTEETTEQKQSRERAEQEKRKAEEARCRQDLQCWAAKVKFDASYPCKQAVQNLAKFDFKWDDGWIMDPVFSRIRWVNKSVGSVAYVGDRIQFQNGFGNWVRHTYECQFDPESKRVIDASASSGRLPD